MITYRKIAAIDGNDTGYNVFDDGNLVGQVYGYTGQSATHEYHEWTAVFDGKEVTDPAHRVATRWQATDRLMEEYNKYSPAEHHLRRLGWRW